jgi:hypothetical protein
MQNCAADAIVIDSLGKLHAHGHGINGHCRSCGRYFMVSMPTLIAARGPDSPIVGMRPLTCAGCGSRETEIRVTAPSKGGSGS